MNITKLLHAFVVVALLSGMAQNSAAEDVITTLTTKEAEAFISGYTGGEYSNLEDGDFGFELNGEVVFLHTEQSSMWFYTVFTEAEVTLEKVNDWNRNMRFSRAYIDEDGDVVIESDLDLEGGATLGAVREFFDTYAISVEFFKKHIGLGASNVLQ